VPVSQKASFLLAKNTRISCPATDMELWRLAASLNKSEGREDKDRSLGLLKRMAF